MRNRLLFLVLLASFPAAATNAPTELFLAGGALRLCSDLQPRACRPDMVEEPRARRDARFVFDDAGAARAVDPLLWRESPGVDLDDLHAVLREAARRSGGRPLQAGEAVALLDGLCRDQARRVDAKCTDQAHARPWRALVDAEQAAVLAAMELPQVLAGQRAIERAHPLASSEPAGTEVLRAFVERARGRAGGARPRIAVVTASALDPFDPVDFYLSLFRAMGADARWWPIDAALNAAVHAGDCGALDQQRRVQLQLPGRERVYPDLARQQQRACEAPEALAALPAQVDAIFFAGGDQWRLRRALVDAADRPNAWLLALRDAHAAGVVVGGTSAGAAVQSGAAMVSNGSTAGALEHGVRVSAPPQAGCDRARRCPPGMPEDAVTWWPAGGTGLAAGSVVDTHFSERARELRLLLMMHASAAQWGYGADETSALRVSQHSGYRQLQAYGAHGGWVFEQVQAEASGVLQATVHYLAPGLAVRLDAAGMSAPATVPSTLAVNDPGAGGPGAPGQALLPGDALQEGALRAAAAVLATGKVQSLQLQAGSGRVTLSRTLRTRAWSHALAQPGVLHLLLRFEPMQGAGAAAASLAE